MSELSRRDSTDEALRRQRLAELIQTCASRASFARIYGLSDAYLWQLQNRHAPFGEKAARTLEAKLGLPRKWFDQPAPV